VTSPPKVEAKKSTSAQDATGPVGVLAALVRSGQTARRIAAQTQTQVVVVTNSSVAQRLNLRAKG
jgi:hypothetical protein